MKRITTALLLISATCISGCKGIGSGGAFPWQQKSAKDPPGRHPLKRAVEKAKKNDDKKDLAWDFGFKKEKELDEPVKMFITWTESEYTQTGKPPIRGFTARAYFYNTQYEPIEVDGQLIVYGFDDTSRDKTKRTADKKFVFPSDHLANQFSTSHLGPSYSLWVPWDEVGGKQKHVSLLPVFRSGKGQIVRGEQIVNILHGKNPAGEQQGRAIARDRGAGQSGIQQVAFNDSAANTPAGSEQAHFGQSDKSNDLSPDTSLKTATIQVPRSTMRHLQAPVAPQSTLQPRRAHEPVRKVGNSLKQQRERSAHYIFDSNRAPIRPRGMRGATPTPSASEQMSRAVNYPAAATVQQPSIRSEPRKPRAPARPHAPPTSGPAPWQRYHAAPPSAPLTTQQSRPQLPPGGFSPSGQPVAN